jgi:hypothetical protein
MVIMGRLELMLEVGMISIEQMVNEYQDEVVDRYNFSIG